jgi:hypothetical protein
MRKLHRHKENTAAIVLAMCVLRALSGNGFTCHNIMLSHIYNVGITVELKMKKTSFWYQIVNFRVDCRR